MMPFVLFNCKRSPFFCKKPPSPVKLWSVLQVLMSGFSDWSANLALNIYFSYSCLWAAMAKSYIHWKTTDEHFQVWHHITHISSTHISPTSGQDLGQLFYIPHRLVSRKSVSLLEMCWLCTKLRLILATYTQILIAIKQVIYVNTYCS